MRDEDCPHMRNALVKNGHTGHAHDPNLESDEADIFTLLVEETVSMGLSSQYG